MVESKHTVKVGDIVLIEAIVDELDMFNGIPIARVTFKESGGCTMYQSDLEVIETSVEEE